MLYCIITEKQEVFKIETTFANTTKQIIFADIEEDYKDEQLKSAVFIRFNDKFMADPNDSNIVFNLLNIKEYLKLVPQTDNNYSIELPSLSLMA